MPETSAETIQVNVRLPKGLAKEMQRVAKAQGLSNAELYRMCAITGFYHIAEGYNKVLVNKGLRYKRRQELEEDDELGEIE